MNTPLLFDRDNIKEIFAKPEFKQLLADSVYKNQKGICEALIDNKAKGAEYVVGLPGAGKTKFALKHMNAQAIQTEEDVLRVLSMDLDDMVFVTSDIEDEIAKKAKRITLIHTSPRRVGMQREQRDGEIMEGKSETAFGRAPYTTARLGTDASILVSRLKTDYANKSRIVMYHSNDPENRDKKKMIKVKDLSNKRKYVEEGVVAASGKRAPAHIVHIQYQLKKVLELAEESGRSSFAVIGKTSGDDYDFGLTQSERIKIINVALAGRLQIFTEGTPDFIKDKKTGKVKKIIPEKSTAIIGKERLPAGFTSGSYKSLVKRYPDFIKHKDAYAVKMFAGYNFQSMGDVKMEGTDESVSATFGRESLIKGDIEAARPYFSPEIFEVLTMPQNLEAIRRRYQIVEEYNRKHAELIDRYKHRDPVTQERLGCDSKGKQKTLTRTYAKKYQKNPEQYDVIMTYIDEMEIAIEREEKLLKKAYKDGIYAKENQLNLERK